MQRFEDAEENRAPKRRCICPEDGSDAVKARCPTNSYKAAGATASESCEFSPIAFRSIRNVDVLMGYTRYGTIGLATWRKVRGRRRMISEEQALDLIRQHRNEVLRIIIDNSIIPNFPNEFDTCHDSTGDKDDPLFLVKAAPEVATHRWMKRHSNGSTKVSYWKALSGPNLILSIQKDVNAKRQSSKQQQHPVGKSNLESAVTAATKFLAELDLANLYLKNKKVDEDLRVLRKIVDVIVPLADSDLQYNSAHEEDSNEGDGNETGHCRAVNSHGPSPSILRIFRESVVDMLERVMNELKRSVPDVERYSDKKSAPASFQREQANVSKFTETMDSTQHENSGIKSRKKRTLSDCLKASPFSPNQVPRGHSCSKKKLFSTHETVAAKSCKQNVDQRDLHEGNVLKGSSAFLVDKSRSGRDRLEEQGCRVSNESHDDAEKIKCTPIDCLSRASALVSISNHPLKFKEAPQRSPTILLLRYLHVEKERASLEFVKHIVENRPETLESFDGDDYRTHLHVACCNHAPMDIIQYLVNVYPRAVFACDNNQATPLHYACRYYRRSKGDVDLQVIRFLVMTFPRAAALHDKYMRLPIHDACEAGASLEVVRLLISALPSSITAGTSLGELPLHLACRKEQKDWKVIDLMVSFCPRTLKFQSRNGEIPLHCAVHNHASKEIIDCLVRAWPDSLHVLTTGSVFPPNMMSNFVDRRRFRGEKRVCLSK